MSEELEMLRNFTLTYNQGKQVQEILQRYRSQLIDERSIVNQHSPWPEQAAELTKDIEYIERLAKIFD
jgi:hypothetical protein